MEVPAIPAVAFRATAQRAGKWFQQSGIQSKNGGVSRYYRGDTRTLLPISTEITGYAAHGLLLLDKDAAVRAGEFLLGTAWDPTLQTFPFELGDEARCAYFFDVGILVRGLISLWRETNDSRWFDGAVAGATAMIRDFTAPDGYHPIIELPSKQPRAYGSWWSQRPGCFHLKAALAWRELAAITGDASFGSHYERQLEFAARSAAEMLESETDELKVMDRLHAYCYYLEGLLHEANRYAHQIRMGIREVGERRRSLASRFLRSDVCAQLLRVRLLAARLDVCPLDLPAANEEFAALSDFQLVSSDARLDGAFAFGRREGQLILHANPVSTVFAVQATQWWSDYAAGRFDAEPADII